MKIIRRQEKLSGLSIGILLENLVKVPSQEDILRVMEAIGGVALKFALEEKEGPFGFNKKEEIPPTDTATNIFEYDV